MYTPSPIRFEVGINPEPDSTKQNTVNIINGNNIRFHRGQVEKIGGHQAFTLTSALNGKPRTILSFEESGNKWQIVGTNSKLYAILGSTVYNITPLQTVAQATLANNPLAFVSGDRTVTVTYTAHGLAIGDRIKLTGASNSHGITAATAINIEHIVATVPTANTFTIEINADPSSSGNGGGASVQIFYEIADGGADAVTASGPGIGTPGVGTPGQIFTDTSLIVAPRVWWLDTFGDDLVCGPGDNGKCYSWGGDTTVAPAIISNAPNADWAWVEDAKLVTFNANVQTNSDTGSLTNWSTGSYFTATRVDMTQFVARAYVNGENIIFSDEGRAFSLRFVGGTKGWVWREIDSPVQIVSPLGHFVIGGRLYIFGENNIFIYNGGAFYPVPNNTLYKFMYDDMNLQQRYKFFVWYNRRYNELHFHYCSENSTENNRAVIHSIGEGWFSKRDIDRTAFDRAEVVGYPILTASDGTIYEHEVGHNDNSAPMNAFYQVAYQAAQDGKIYTECYGAEIDGIQTGAMTAELYGKDRARAPETLLQSFTINENTQQIECTVETRWRSWLMRSNVVDGYFRSGGMREYVQAGGEF